MSRSTFFFFFLLLPLALGLMFGMWRATTKSAGIDYASDEPSPAGFMSQKHKVESTTEHHEEEVVKKAKMASTTTTGAETKHAGEAEHKQHVVNDAAQAALKSWVQYDAATCDFPIQNLPYGVFRPSASAAPRVGVAIGDFALDLSELVKAGLFKQAKHVGDGSCFSEGALNTFMSMGRAAWTETRALVQHLLDANTPTLRDNKQLQATALVPLKQVTMELPAKIGDYTDFYASRNHAYNVGVMFRGKDNALQPNWTWLPVG